MPSSSTAYVYQALPNSLEEKEQGAKKAEDPHKVEEQRNTKDTPLSLKNRVLGAAGSFIMAFFRNVFRSIYPLYVVSFAYLSENTPEKLAEVPLTEAPIIASKLLGFTLVRARKKSGVNSDFAMHKAVEALGENKYLAMGSHGLKSVGWGAASIVLSIANLYLGFFALCIDLGINALYSVGCALYETTVSAMHGWQRGTAHLRMENFNLFRKGNASPFKRKLPPTVAEVAIPVQQGTATSKKYPTISVEQENSPISSPKPVIERPIIEATPVTPNNKSMRSR